MSDGLRVGIFGAGTWGTALAHLLGHKGHSVLLWAYESEVTAGIESTSKNPLYLSDTELPPFVRATNDPEAVVFDADMILFVVPAQFVRTYASLVAGLLTKSIPLVICSKGIERKTLATMHQVFCEEFPDTLAANISVLSGPSFAAEVVRGMPTNVTVASQNSEVAKYVQNAMATRAFRVYTGEDVVGVELGGALKNVMALAVGASDGLGFGNNTRAGLITRGLSEITRLAVSMGARPETLLGLAGVGDLILTCTSDLSRNRQVGKRLGQGERIADIVDQMRMVAEGVPTAESAHQLAIRQNIELPIMDQVYQVLYQDKTVEDALIALQGRRLREEWPA